jgi:2-polyprenyl-6-methoxyphenol hydroxylase-like FAD-dependent oxidoreductase
VDGWQTTPRHSVTLMRGDLVGALRQEAVLAGAEIVTGARVSADDPRLADADLVVGADGIWSATRRLLNPDGPEPAYAGMYTISGTSEPKGLEAVSFNMIFGRRGAFLYLPTPDGTVWWAAQVSEPEQPDLRNLGLAQLATLFRAEPTALSILSATRRVDSATLNHVLARVERHHDDHVVLIGDAAHPVGAGQGASMALEDAVVLAQQLHQEDAVESALAAYDRLRRKRVDKMVTASASNRDAKTAGPIAARLRNVFMPIFFPRVYVRATSWLYTYDPGTLTRTPVS